MTGRTGGATTGRVARELAVERHERAVELIDVEAIRRALAGSPVALTALERDVVITIADLDGLDRQITARGLGLSLNAVEYAITRRRRRVPSLTRDLWAAVMLRPASALVDAVRAGDAEAVAAVLAGLDAQGFAALSVVLAAAVSDASILPAAVDDPARIEACEQPAM